jgi:protein-export membrane protein SecD
MLIRAAVVGGLALGSACVLWPTIGPVPEPLERLVPGRIALGLDFVGGVHLGYSLEGVPPEETDQALEQAIDIVRRRVDALDLGDVVVVRRGDQILVEMQGTSVETMQRARSLIGAQHSLVFARVDEETEIVPAPTALPAGIEVRRDGPTGDPGAPERPAGYLVARGPDARRRLEGLALVLPAGRAIVVGEVPEHERQDGGGGEVPWRTYLVVREGSVGGEHIDDASATVDQMGSPSVMVQLDREGAAAFEQLTRESVHRRLAIVLDGVVLSAPMVQMPIGGGRAQITLGASTSSAEQYREAEDLAIALRSGSLPHPLRLDEEWVIEPVYDASVVAATLAAVALLLLAFVVVMTVRHGIAGIVVGAGPILCILLAFALLAWLDAVLSSFSAAGLAAALVLTALSAAVPLEVSRLRSRSGADHGSARRAGARVLLLAGAPVHLAMLVAASMLFALGHGLLRGFAAGLLLGSVAAGTVALLWTSIAIGLTSRAAPPAAPT